MYRVFACERTCISETGHFGPARAEIGRLIETVSTAGAEEKDAIQVGVNGETLIFMHREQGPIQCQRRTYTSPLIEM